MTSADIAAELRAAIPRVRDGAFPGDLFVSSVWAAYGDAVLFSKAWSRNLPLSRWDRIAALTRAAQRLEAETCDS